MAFRQFSTGILEGLNEDENPHALKNGELVEATNAARIGNAVGTRPGTLRPGSGEDYENKLPQVSAADVPIQGMFEYRSDFDANRRLIVLADHGTEQIFYQDNARLATSSPKIQITAGQDNHWTFGTHNNLLWAAGGAPTDDIWTWDGVAGVGTAAIERALTDKGTSERLRPKYVFTWRGYVFLRGFRVVTTATASNNPITTRYATFGSDTTLDASWLDSNTIGFNATRPGMDAYGASFATGFGRYQDNDGDFLLLLNNRGISSVRLAPGVDFAISDSIANGCVSQRSFVSLGLDSGDAVYLSDKGIHSLRQSQQHGSRADTFLSWKIRKTFATLNKSRLADAVGAYDDVEGWVVFAVPTGADSFNSLLLVLDTKDLGNITAENARWYLWTLEGAGASSPVVPLRINEMVFARGETRDERRLYFGTTVGDVGYITTDVFSDFAQDGAAAEAYSVQFRTKDRSDFASTGVQDVSHGMLDAKTLGDVMVSLRPGGGHNPSIRFVFDYGNTISDPRTMTMPTSGAVFGTDVFGTGIFGTSSETRNSKVYGTGNGQTVGFRFTHSTANEPFLVNRVDYEIEVSGESVSQ